MPQLYYNPTVSLNVTLYVPSTMHVKVYENKENMYNSEEKVIYICRRLLYQDHCVGQLLETYLVPHDLMFT